MSRLYPTLEDFKVDELNTAQSQLINAIANQPTASSTSGSALYPTLDNYMGMNITNSQISLYGDSSAVGSGWRRNIVSVAPITQNDKGIARSEIKQGLRRAVLCKDGKGIIGIRVQAIDKGLFISFVGENTPAAMAGLRFGDQILEINNQVVAGWTTDKARKFLKDAPKNDIIMVLRDRPFERTVTMNKDSNGCIGFMILKGKIIQLVQDGSAARNGLLIDHMLIEINGQNVLGLKDKEIKKIIDISSTTVTVTVMPEFVYRMVKMSGT